MNQKHDSKPRQTLVESPPWMGGGGGNGGGGQGGNFSNPVQVRQVGILVSYWYCSLSRAIMFELYSTSKVNSVISPKISIRYNSGCFPGAVSTEQQSHAATKAATETKRGAQRTNADGPRAGPAGERVDGLQLRRCGGQDQLAVRPVPLHQQGQVHGEGAHRDAH